MSLINIFYYSSNNNLTNKRSWYYFQQIINHFNYMNIYYCNCVIKDNLKGNKDLVYFTQYLREILVKNRQILNRNSFLFIKGICK